MALLFSQRRRCPAKGIRAEHRDPAFGFCEPQSLASLHISPIYAARTSKRLCGGLATALCAMTRLQLTPLMMPIAVLTCPIERLIPG